jgi:tetratricopeptide (TPR) repeat protein
LGGQAAVFTGESREFTGKAPAALRYRGNMSPSPEEETGSPTPLTRQARARQWSRTAWAMALLFASLPVACRLFVGAWGFDGAFEVSCFCLVLGTYLHLLSRRSLPALPDAATLLDRAIRLALEGRTDRAILLLTEAIRLSPRLWQAFQYRGELYLLEPETVAAALDDFTEAIRLAPEEPHLYALREQAHRLLEDARDGGNPVSGRPA